MTSLKVLTIATVSVLIALTSFVMISEDSDAAEPVDSVINAALTAFIGGNEDTGSVTLDNNELYIEYTIQLPALEKGQEFIIEGGGRTITTLRPDDAHTGPVFVIDPNNKGTYTFQDISIIATVGSGSESFLSGTGDEGAIQLIRADVWGSTSYAFVAVGLDNLKIEDCCFESFTKVIDSDIKEVEITDSAFISCFQVINIKSESNVSFDNCFFTYSGGEDGVITIQDISGGAVTLSVSDCTYSISLSTGGFFIIVIGDETDITLNIERTLFEDMLSGAAVVIGGNVGGSVVIDQCLFTDCNTNTTYGVISIYNESTEKKLNVEISNTTFYDNIANVPNDEYAAFIGIEGYEDNEGKSNISGKIVNSTFWDNTISASGADYPLGVIRLGAGDFDIIFNTFLNNIFEDGYPGDYYPNALRLSPGAKVTVDYNIFAYTNVYSDGDSGIFKDVGYVESYYSGYGNIDIVPKDANDVNKVEGLFSRTSYPLYNYGLNAGCTYDDGLYYDFDPREVCTLLITPNLHDGNESADDREESKSGLPETDQRGELRTGRIDVGAVTISSAVYYMNGGGWDIVNSSDDYTPDTSYLDIYSGSLRNGAVYVDWYTPFVPQNVSHADALMFLGWSTNPEAEFPDPGFMPTNFETVPDGSYVSGIYYAVWGDKNVVMFDFGDKREPIFDTFDTIDDIQYPNVGSIGGMRVSGWTMDVEGEFPLSPEFYFEGNLILYAQWEPAGYTVTFKPENGGNNITVDVEHGGKVSPPAVTMEGHEVDVWVTSTNVEWDFSKGVTGNMILTAKWKILVFEVTFDPTNNTLPWIVMVNWGERVSAPSSPSMEGYDFNGWFTGSDEEWSFSTPIKSHMVLYAQWVEVETGGEEGGGGGLLSDNTTTIIAATAGAALASIGVIPVAASAAGATGVAGVAAQTATGNVFQQGMATDPTGAETSGEEKNRRSVVFDPRNGRSSWATNVFNGRQADRPGDPRAPKGKRFLYWSESVDGPEFSFLTPITRVTHLYAVYADVETTEGEN